MTGHLVEFTVRGVPAPQGSKDQFGRESSEKVPPWREAVRGEAQRAMETGGVPTVVGPVGVVIWFTLPRPASHHVGGKHDNPLKGSAPTAHGKRPDIDKLVRSTLDALTVAGVWVDDSQVAELVVVKNYGPPGQVGARIQVGHQLYVAE